VTIGIDLVRVEDVRASLACFGRSYLERIFTAREISDCMKLEATAPQHLAARFAAKEAVRKLLQIEPSTGLGFRSVEVVRRPSGAPEVVLHGTARALAETRGIAGLSLSLTHETEYAAAIAIALPTTQLRRRQRHRRFRRFVSREK
jgi:holo-[acyl-carrier protein] synthase